MQLAALVAALTQLGYPVTNSPPQLPRVVLLTEPEPERHRLVPPAPTTHLLTRQCLGKELQV